MIRRYSSFDDVARPHAAAAAAAMLEPDVRPPAPPPDAGMHARSISEDRKLAVDSRSCFKPWSLAITVISGSKLKGSDLGGGISSDPYVRITLEGKVERTKSVRFTTNPKWNEKFLLYAMLTRSKLLVECLDHEGGRRDDDLGFIEVSLESLPLEEESVQDYVITGGKGGSSLRLSLRLCANFILRVTDDSTAHSFSPCPPILARHVDNSKSAWSGVDVAHEDLTWLYDGTRASTMAHIEAVLGQIFSLDVSTACRIAATKFTQILCQCLTCCNHMSDRALIEVLGVVCNFFYLRVGSELSAQIPLLQSSLGTYDSAGDPMDFRFEDWVRVLCQLVDGDLVSDAIEKALRPYHLCCLPAPNLHDLVDVGEILEQFGTVVEERVHPKLNNQMRDILEKHAVFTANQADFKRIVEFFLVDLAHYYTTIFASFRKSFDRAKKPTTRSTLQVRVAEAFLRSMAQHVTNAASFMRSKRLSPAFNAASKRPTCWYVLQLGFLIGSTSLLETQFRDFLFKSCGGLDSDDSADAAQQVLAPYFSRAKRTFQELEIESAACLVSLVLPPPQKRKSLMATLKIPAPNSTKYPSPDYKTLFQIIFEAPNEASAADPDLDRFLAQSGIQIFTRAPRVRVVDELVNRIFQWVSSTNGSSRPSPQMALEELQLAVMSQNFSHEDLIAALASECKTTKLPSIVSWELLKSEAFQPSHFYRRLESILRRCLDEPAYLQQLLQVRVIGADELQHERNGGKTDPYVLVTVRRRSPPFSIVAGPYKTKVVKNNVSPVWNEDTQFVLDSTALYDMELHCEIFDWERVRAHRCIGCVRHSLAAYDIESGKTRGQKLSAVEAAAHRPVKVTSEVLSDGKPEGKLHFELVIEDVQRDSTEDPRDLASEAFAAVGARKCIEGHLNPTYVHYQCHGCSLWRDSTRGGSEPFLRLSLETAAENNFRKELANAGDEQTATSWTKYDNSLMETVINHPAARILFHNFVSTERHLQCMLEYWVAATAYFSRWSCVNVDSAVAVREMERDAAAIIDEFLREGAEKEISLEASLREAILDGAASYPSLVTFEPSLRRVVPALRDAFRKMQCEDEAYRRFVTNARG